MTDTGKLVRLFTYYKKTLEVDEGGDANLHEYLCEEGWKLAGKTIEEVLEGFLVWANGENWQQFLDTAKPGDVPPKD
jgi:hypothetical protein